MRFLVTGTAGFVGFHVAKRLLADRHQVIGIDGMTPYYDVTLKERRHAVLSDMPGFTAHRVMLEDAAATASVFERAAPDIVIHLAAQAGVRYSITNPRAYIDSNVIGTFNILELCRAHPPAHLMIASTSSVYGANTEMPFAETDAADTQLTLYAATKKSTEMMAHSYAYLWKVPTTMFRFFSVYGPWGRPDMALFKFVHNMLKNEPIDVYNNGKLDRDFTYIDDLVEAIVRLSSCTPAVNMPICDADSLSPVAPFRIVNIGGGHMTPLMDFIAEIEAALGRPAIRNYMPMQMGDVSKTDASTELLEALTGFRPQTPVSKGVREFVTWYRDYYRA